MIFPSSFVFCVLLHCCIAIFSILLYISASVFSTSITVVEAILEKYADIGKINIHNPKIKKGINIASNRCPSIIIENISPTQKIITPIVEK